MVDLVGYWSGITDKRGNEAASERKIKYLHMRRLAKNLINGAGRVLQIAPSRPRHSMKSAPISASEALQTDVKALRSDWVRIGQDMRVAIKKYAQSSGQ